MKNSILHENDDILATENRSRIKRRAFCRASSLRLQLDFKIFIGFATVVNSFNRHYSCILRFIGINVYIFLTILFLTVFLIVYVLIIIQNYVYCAKFQIKILLVRSITNFSNFYMILVLCRNKRLLKYLFLLYCLHIPVLLMVFKLILMQNYVYFRKFSMKCFIYWRNQQFLFLCA